MEWSVILTYVIPTSVVVAAIVSAIFNVIIAKINNRAKRKNFNYEKLYSIFEEIQEHQAPPSVSSENLINTEVANQHIAYYELLLGRYNLSKPLLSRKIVNEIETETKRFIQLVKVLREKNDKEYLTNEEMLYELFELRLMFI